MAFMLGSFTSGLFGGMRDMAQIADAWEGIKVKQKQNAAGDVAQQAMKTSTPADTSMPAGQMDTPPINKTGAVASETLPDLESMPKPKFMNTKAMKSATAAEAAAADEKTVTPGELTPLTKSATVADSEVPMGIIGRQMRAPAELLSPSMKSASAADAPAAVPGAPPGALIWTPDKGLHPAVAGESGLQDSMGPALGKVGSAVGAVGTALGGGVRYDLSRGLSSQQPASTVGGGQVVPGNIDLNNRPVAPNGNGYSTVLSMSIGTGKGEVLIPRVSDDGRILSPDEAKQQYQKTGRHLGIFSSPDAATAYAKQLHSSQASQYGAQTAMPASPGLPAMPMFPSSGRPADTAVPRRQW